MGFPLSLASTSELFQETDEVRNAAGWRAPLHVNDLRALAHKVDRKQLKSDVDDARRCGKQIVRFCVVRVFHARFVVLNPGLPINTASDRVLRATGEWRSLHGPGRGSLATVTSPPIMRASLRERARPSPVPPWRRAVRESAWVK